jgi:hypothetical protein
MREDTDDLPERERARVRSRDRKIRRPRMVVDNPGLKKLTVDLAERRRRRAAPAAPPKPAAAPPARGRRRRLLV